MTPVPRNQPCPCSSGKRFKHCCSREDAPLAAMTAGLAPILPDAETGAVVLSVVLPYFHKIREFERVLLLNVPYFARPGIEVVLVLGENSEEAALLGLLGNHPGIRWKVMVNDQLHPWRPPCKAINVGLRHASGRYVLIASPESAFVGDFPALALQVMSEHPDGIAIGRVGFARFDDLGGGRSLAQAFAAAVPEKPYLHTCYGSICGPRAAFEEVGGYDESFTTSGGDDDNVRVRLEMAGKVLLACTEMRLLHRWFEARHGGEH